MSIIFTTKWPVGVIPIKQSIIVKENMHETKMGTVFMRFIAILRKAFGHYYGAGSAPIGV